MAAILGNVFNIQRYSVKDGPGIRTTVFLKGCPLRCWWCHNPESQAEHVELAVNSNICVQCGGCWSACPHNSPMEECNQALVDAEHCTVCGACVEVCPMGGRTLMGRQLSVDEIMDEVRKDCLFYEESGGGVTLSGGEPLVQIDFAREVLQRCQAESISTAVDTCGYCQQLDLLSIASCTDLFLYDLKAIDPQIHLRHTGVSNEMILENLIALGRVHSHIVIRIPIISGVNDSPSELEALARFVTTLDGVIRVDLLPYHPLGSQKHERIGRKSSPRAEAVPTAETLESAEDLFRSVGLHEVHVA